MAGSADRLYDKTHLSVDMALDRGIMHRDYAAHMFRWSHAYRMLLQRGFYKEARILDIGCGKDFPLAKMLYSNRMSGAKYIGVDMNKLEIPEMLVKAADGLKMEITCYQQTDAGLIKNSDLLEDYGTHHTANFITMFEVAEHMHPGILHRLLSNTRNLIDEKGVFLLSTPCYNGGAAGNHVNEMSYLTLKEALGHIGWYIEDEWGTFASQRDAFPVLRSLYGEPVMKFIEDLTGFFDSNVISNIIAPMVPRVARNVMWVCRRADPNPVLLLDDLLSKEKNQHPDIACLFSGEYPDGAQ